jgi:hypothetical protein
MACFLTKWIRGVLVDLKFKGFDVLRLYLGQFTDQALNLTLVTLFIIPV